MHFVAEDSTGQIQVVLADREVRTIIGRRALDLAAEVLTVSVHFFCAFFLVLN